MANFKHINQAFIYGSFANNKADKFSDIDLMIIGQVDEDKLIRKISPLEQSLGREINYIIFSPRNFKARKKDPFVHQVLKDKKIFLINKNAKQ